MTLESHRFIRVPIDMGMGVAWIDDELDEIVNVWSDDNELWIELKKKESR